MSRDSKAEPLVWVTTSALQDPGRITQL
jgi:hypothetical protein